MTERIQKIMDLENIKPGEFAEQIGINRSAVSHILNGRNKPSLDVVHRILSRYDYISSDWLLFGKGEMYKKNLGTSGQHIPKHQPSLFDENAVNIPKQEPASEYKQENQPKVVQQMENQLVKDINEVRIPVTKKITKLVIFYSDNTFDTFAPDKSIF